MNRYYLIQSLVITISMCFEFLSQCVMILNFKQEMNSFLFLVSLLSIIVYPLVKRWNEQSGDVIVIDNGCLSERTVVAIEE